LTLNLRSDFGNSQGKISRQDSRQDFEFDRVIAPRAKRGTGLDLRLGLPDRSQAFFGLPR
jgi:hypothetical protein